MNFLPLKGLTNMTTNWRIDAVVNENLLNVLEDSIRLNPHISRPDADTIINHICYKVYETNAISVLSKLTIAPALDTEPMYKLNALQRAAPELLEALKNTVARMDENHPKKAKRDDLEAVYYNATFYRDREAARAVIQKAEDK